MIEKLKTITELAGFLSVDERTLTEIDPDTNYKTFQIPKPGKTEKRTIETPTGQLRYLLDRISDGLQWLYLDHKTDAAFGFIRALKNDRDIRNIFTNAKAHLGRKYLLNIDLDNFFHQVDTNKVHGIFNDYHIFSFKPETEELLTRLVTYKGRLPMGSPTSPALSNFATIGLDKELGSWAARSSFAYTRYVDDLSFSSNCAISDTHFGQISEILHAHHFVADDKKIHWFGKDDVKEVTGLLLGDKITIPDPFLHDFETDINKLKEVIAFARQYPDGHVFDWIEKLKQVIHGRLAFLNMIYGKNHPVYQKYSAMFGNIGQPQDSDYSYSWRYAGYEFH